MRKGAVFGIALVMLMSGCSKFAAQSDVEIRKVPVELAFGNPPEPKAGPLQPIAPPSAIELPPLIEPTFDEPPAEDLCPPLSNFGAEEAVPEIPASDSDFFNYMKTRVGDYLYNYVWNYAGEEQHAFAGIKTLGDLQLENDLYQGSTPGGYTFNMYDEVDPKMIWGFGAWASDPDAATNGQGAPDEQDHDGFFLNQIVIPNHDPNKRPTPEFYTYRSTGQLFKLMDFPAREGQSYSITSQDTALKPGDGVRDPINGGFLATGSPGSLTVTSVVGPKRIVSVCADVAQAWEVNVTITADEADDKYDFELIGKFFFDTAYGGQPVRSEYTITGSLIQGNFFSQMMRLNPGEYA